MSIYKAEAIVLKHFNLGEADKIITFYSKEHGKIRAVANNVRKTKSRMAGLISPFSYSNIKIYRGKSLDKINQINIKYAFPQLRNDLTKMAYASYMAELIDKTGMEADPNPPLFSLLLTTFYKMRDCTEDEMNYIFLLFKYRLVAIIGFKPDLETCNNCGKKIKISSSNKFDISSGGMICSDCSLDDHKNEILYFTGEAYKILSNIYSSKLTKTDNLRISTKACKQLNNIIDNFIKYHLEISLKSEKFLYMIRDLG